MRKWVEAVVSAPTAGRYDLCEVGNAIGRTGFPELLPNLQHLLDEDLARLKKAREGYREAQRRGDIGATSDACTLYGNQYREAFVRIGGQEAANIVAAYLEDRIFGFEAAVALKGISDRLLNVPNPSFHRQWLRFEEVAAARTRRASPSKIPLADTLLAQAIFATIDRLASEEADEEAQQLAIRMAPIALAMPHSNQDALIDRVMALPQPSQSKLQLLAAKISDGRVPDAENVMQTIDDWLTEAYQDERTAWHKRQDTLEIEPWLELLPFTTCPEAVLSGLEKVKAFYGSGWRQRWERVLNAVASVPGAKGEALLANLARAHKDIAGDFEWMKAILGRNTPSAVLMYVDLYIEGVFGLGANAINGWHVGRELAGYAKNLPELESELRKRYVSATGSGRQMLEHFFGHFGGDHDLISMVKKYAVGGQAYDSRMDAVVESVALRHEPMHEGSSSYYVHPASISKLRKALFGLIRGTTGEATLAKKCLVEIDRLRDQHGIAANDTRHPDVLSEIPWPPEVGKWFDEPRKDPGLAEAEAGLGGEILPEDIAEFAKMKGVKVESADEWMSVMSKLPEEKVKKAFAKLLSEPTKKDWGGEPNDHYSSNVTANGTRTTAAFLFKGPAMFREMTLEMCGKRADQIYRLAKSGAEISVVQHSHLIGETVRETLRCMIAGPEQPRKYCVIDGQASYRILKAYGFL